LRFSGGEPREFTLRGLTRENAVGHDKAAYQIRKSFAIDPTIYSPLDEASQPKPESTVVPPEEGVDSLGIEVSVGDYTPAVNTPTPFSAKATPSGEALAASESPISRYEWTFAPLAPDVEAESRTGAEVEYEFPTPGDYAVTVEATDVEGISGSRTVFVTAEPGPPAEVFPVATDAGGECVFPPTGERFPATGQGAATHLGYGCGDWKVYEVEPGARYTVRSAVDGCSDCVLYDAAYVVEEPAPDAPKDPDDPGTGPWEVIERVEDPKGKEFAGEVHELGLTPDTERIRVRNIDGNDGAGFYASVFADSGGAGG
jgi:hypothetical protein